MTPDRRRDVALALLLFVFGCGLAAVAFSRQLADPFRVDDDARQHLAWMARYADPELFPGSPYVEYARFYSTPLFKGVYFVLSRFADPLEAGKRVAVVLCGLSAALFFVWGRRLGGPRFGLLVSLAYLAMPAVGEPFSGGLQRAFAAPLLLGLLILASAELYEWTGALLAVAMLLYPVAAALGLGTVVATAAWLRPHLRPRRRIVFWAGLALFAAAIGWTAWLRTSGAPGFLGRFVTRAEALEDPAFQRHGRFVLVPLQSYAEAVAQEPALGSWSGRAFFAVGLGLAALVLARPGRERAAPALGLLLSSAVCFELANAVFLKLFVPIRYVQHPFSILAPLAIALCPAALLALAPNGLPRRLALVALRRGARGTGRRERQSAGADTGPGPNEDERALLRFLATRPKSAVVAADPFLSDDILTFSRRTTFLSYELAHPWFVGYRALFEARVDDYYRSVFSEDPEAARTFACREGVSLFALARERFERPRLGPERLFFEPEESRLRAALSGVDPRRSALLSAPPERVVFENARYRVVAAASCPPAGS